MVISIWGDNKSRVQSCSKNPGYAYDIFMQSSPHTSLYVNENSVITCNDVDVTVRVYCVLALTMVIFV